MISSLPVSRPAANRRVMRNGLIQFMLLIAALLAGVDMPAMAFDNVPATLVEAHHQTCVEVSNDGAPDDNSPTGSGSELLHHHHCPAGLIVEDSALAASAVLARDSHLSRASAALASRVIAPPTQPPAA